MGEEGDPEARGPRPHGWELQGKEIPYDGLPCILAQRNVARYFKRYECMAGPSEDLQNKGV